MKKVVVRMFIVFAVTGLLALAAAGSAFAQGPPLIATMVFGNPDVGSGCNFPCIDDESFHAVDKIIPGAVTISVGGTVFFDVNGFHQVAIYSPGISPQDIVPNLAAFPFVNDPNGRIIDGLGVVTVDFEYTFDQPGKYLVICNVTPHFEDAQMWGWVNVVESAVPND